MDDLAQQAIDQALRGNWEEAAVLNKQILKQNPQDGEALNRLARASLELGDLKKAVFCYKKVLRIDPYNEIAQRALLRLAKSKRRKSLPAARLRGQGKKRKGNSLSFSGADLFLEEPGKTKTVSLIHLGDEAVINNLNSGDAIKLVPHSHRVSVKTMDRKYIGRLPDDLSRRLIKLTRAGNEYTSLVKSANPDNIKIFIREIKRSQNLGNIPSFPITEKLGYLPSSLQDSMQAGKPDNSV